MTPSTRIDLPPRLYSSSGSALLHGRPRAPCPPCARARASPSLAQLADKAVDDAFRASFNAFMRKHRQAPSE